MMDVQLRAIRYLARAVFSNAALLIANTLAGSFFGFVFWVVAARSYTPAQVGLGAAYISALTLLAAVGEMGLGTVLIRFAPTMGARQARFINSAVATVGSTTLVAATVFALGTPLWSPEMEGLTRSGLTFAVFVGTTVAFGLAQVLDRVCVAFEATQYMLLRNLLANVVRVTLALAMARLLGSAGLVLSVGAASLATFILSAVAFAPRIVPGYRLRPAFAWRLLWEKAGYSLGNHFATLLWTMPALVYPLITVALLGARANAHFYITWMVANLLWIVPTSISTAAFARAANAGCLDERPYWGAMRLTLAGLVLPAVALAAAAPLVLRIFGHDYGADGPDLFVLLTLSIFPYTVNTAVITYHRIQHNIGRVVWVSGCTTLLCLALSVAMGALFGLPGIGVGWLGGQMAGVVLGWVSCRTAARSPAMLLQDDPAPAYYGLADTRHAE